MRSHQHRTREADRLASVVVDAALHIHKALGPGLLESVYETVLTHKLEQRGLRVERQVSVPFEFDGIQFDEGLRVDLFVERILVVELKSVTELDPIHTKQLLTYLRLLDRSLGLLVNFGGLTLMEGFRRVVNRHVDD
jgi:GxxExxY protein